LELEVFVNEIYNSFTVHKLNPNPKDLYKSKKTERKIVLLYLPEIDP